MDSVVTHPRHAADERFDTARISAAVDAVEADPAVGALVVTGTPPAFCAGADLSHLGTSQHDGLRRIYEGFLRMGVEGNRDALMFGMLRSDCRFLPGYRPPYIPPPVAIGGFNGLVS